MRGSPAEAIKVQALREGACRIRADEEKRKPDGGLISVANGISARILVTRSARQLIRSSDDVSGSFFAALSQLKVLESLRYGLLMFAEQIGHGLGHHGSCGNAPLRGENAKCAMNFLWEVRTEQP